MFAGEFDLELWVLPKSRVLRPYHLTYRKRYSEAEWPDSELFSVFLYPAMMALTVEENGTI